MDKPYPYLLRKAEIDNNAFSFSHPWNPESHISGTHLSKLGGLERSGVSIARVPPGKDSFVYHLHHREEEWIYILSGRAVARIDGEEYEMAAGDFVAFPAPSVAHNLSNPFDEEVVYLMGGTHTAIEIADFPDHGRRMVRLGEDMQVYDLEDGRDFFELGPVE
jgi:uncharacterized cupin superfamily protein